MVRLAIALTAVPLLAIGPCGDRSPTPITFKNTSEHDVRIFVETQNGQERETRYVLGPGTEELVFSAPSQGISTCTSRALTARTEDTNEKVDRAAPPLCRGDTWVIGG